MAKKVIIRGGRTNMAGRRRATKDGTKTNYK